MLLTMGFGRQYSCSLFFRTSSAVLFRASENSSTNLLRALVLVIVESVLLNFGRMDSKISCSSCKDFGEIVQESFGVRPDLSTSSPIFKGAKRFYDLASKKKNLKRKRNGDQDVVKEDEEIPLAGEIFLLQ